MKFQAHRGVSSEAPENTLPAIRLAIAQGYGVIEMDVDVTADGVFVLLHDHHLGRTARTKDGGRVPDGLTIGDVTYARALEYEYGSWFSNKFTGTPIPLLADILDTVRDAGLTAKIDNKYRNFSPEDRRALYALLSLYPETARLTCPTVELLREALEYMPDAYYHYDGIVSDETLAQLAALLPRERLTVWLPIANRLTSWVKVPFADKALADKVRRVAELGIWIISSYEDAELAYSLGAEIVETNGIIKPEGKNGIIADMHTHSENSHDSVCPLSEMRAAEIARGVSVMALTDHFDTHSYCVYDIHAPIERGHAQANELNGDGAECLILRGIELGEAFWSREAYDRIRRLDYDVVIGSVHVIRQSEGYCIYSHTDFSALAVDRIYEILDAYFDDVLTMLGEVDFDILAHLTCPVRYVRGKYGIDIDLSRFNDKIDRILGEVIRSGKALEVNTSGYSMMGELLPDADILKRYYAMGGYLVTLGSDAHVAENAAAHFDEALSCLREIGFRHIYYYKNRQAIQCEI